MLTKHTGFAYTEYESDAELMTDEKTLLQIAKDTTAYAYAPYSGFLVGAAALLVNGEIITGTNQENASYPVGICAERTLLSAASSLHSGVGIKTIAISYNNTHGQSNRPVSPCGICRQTLAEFETRVKQPMRLILSGLEGKVFIIAKASLLLPLGFGGEDLSR